MSGPYTTPKVRVVSAGGPCNGHYWVLYHNTRTNKHLYGNGTTLTWKCNRCARIVRAFIRPPEVES